MPHIPAGEAMNIISPRQNQSQEICIYIHRWGFLLTHGDYLCSSKISFYYENKMEKMIQVEADFLEKMDICTGFIGDYLGYTEMETFLSWTVW